MIKSTYCYPAVLILVLLTVILLDYTSQLLRDTSTGKKKPFSFSKVQLAFWFILIISSFITIILCVKGHDIPTFSNSSLILLGLSAGTMTAGRLIDLGDQGNDAVSRIQDTESEGFFKDILSDAGGIGLHRLQCVVFNLIIGGQVLHETVLNLAAKGILNIDHIIPEVSPASLVLLGLSSGAYVAVKATENKAQTPPILSPVDLVVAAPALNSAKTEMVSPQVAGFPVAQTMYTPRNVFVKVGSIGSGN